MNRAEKINFIKAALRGEQPGEKLDATKYTDVELHQMIKILRKHGEDRESLTAEEVAFFNRMVGLQKSRPANYRAGNNVMIDWDKEWYNGKVYYDEVEKVSKVWRE